jgi:hypothetical protein
MLDLDNSGYHKNLIRSVVDPMLLFFSGGGAKGSIQLEK